MSTLTAIRMPLSPLTPGPDCRRRIYRLLSLAAGVPGLGLVRKVRHLEAAVTADQDAAGDRGGAEPVADGVDRRVDRVLPVVGERQHELHGIVGLEVGDGDADERQ